MSEQGFREEFGRALAILEDCELALLRKIPGAAKVHLGIRERKLTIVIYVYKKMLGEARRAAPRTLHKFPIEISIYYPPPPHQKTKRKKKRY